MVAIDAVMRNVDGMMAAIFEVIGEKVQTPFPRLTYEESLNRYGTDKPDLRHAISAYRAGYLPAPHQADSLSAQHPRLHRRPRLRRRDRLR